jgi:predicted amidohydrolase
MSSLASSNGHMTEDRTLAVAVVQLNSGADREQNVASALAGIDQAARAGARLVILPEIWPYLGPEEENRANAESIPGPITDLFAGRAQQHDMYIHGCTILETEAGSPYMHNTAFVVDPVGHIIARYRKIHMFDVVLGGGEQYRESATMTPGDEIVTVDIDGINVGLATCYDLRFPELFRILALRGASAVALPAAFTLTTGKDHWETLIRARAIENGFYMMASAQWGKHPPGNWCYGRSMIVDPWGTVLATAADGVGIAITTISQARVDAVRGQIPSLANRQPHAYRWPDTAEVGLESARSS